MMDFIFSRLIICILDSDFLARFQIGREKNPEKSEVARLIQQSLDQDKKRMEIQRREVERQQDIERELQREEEDQQAQQFLEEEMNARREAEKHRVHEDSERFLNFANYFAKFLIFFNF